MADFAMQDRIFANKLPKVYKGESGAFVLDLTCAPHNSRHLYSTWNVENGGNEATFRIGLLRVDFKCEGCCIGVMDSGEHRDFGIRFQCVGVPTQS